MQLTTKTLQFKDENENIYHLQIVYSPTLYRTKLYKVNERLETPIYHYCIKDKNEESSFHCTTRRKDIEGQINLYQIVKKQAILDYTNREIVERVILDGKRVRRRTTA